MPVERLEQVAGALERLGLTLVGWRDLADLPTECLLGDDGSRDGSLVVIGNRGGDFWRLMRADGRLEGEHPLDRVSEEVTADVLDSAQLPRRELLYPISGSALVNLPKLLDALEWQYPSPLGMGIHARYGLWQAVRAVWWLADSAPVVTHSGPAPDLCATCASQACVSACPASAVRTGDQPDLNACADYRFEDDSRCASTCLARLACPIAPEHRYGADQMAHHYRLEGSMIAEFRSDPDAV